MKFIPSLLKPPAKALLLPPLIILLLLPTAALAAINCGTSIRIRVCIDSLGGTFGLPGGLTASGIIIEIIKFLLSIAAVLAVLAIVIGGIVYIMSLGDEAKAAR